MRTLTLPDLVGSTQETVLVLRHGRRDEEEYAYGAERRELYRSLQRSAAQRELTRDLLLKYRGEDVTIKMHRIYHHAGDVVRVAYLTDCKNFKEASPRHQDVAIVQIAAWIASLTYSTAPSAAAVLLHWMDDSLSEIKESKICRFNLLPPEQVEQFVIERLEALLSASETPAEALPPCTDEDRFAIKTDPYAKCRTMCRARDVCHQYLLVREAGAAEFGKAREALASI